jgi:hypothetical protein
MVLQKDPYQVGVFGSWKAPDLQGSFPVYKPDAETAPISAQRKYNSKHSLQGILEGVKRIEETVAFLGLTMTL